MALQGSGAISFDNLRNEYGNGGSIALSEMYRGGSFVLNHSNNGNVPTSGTISLSNFYSQNNTAPSWSTTLTVGGFSGKLSEYGYGNAGANQNNNATYGSVSDNTVDILSGAFFRQCKWSSISGGVLYLEIDGGSTSWSTIVVNGTTFTRTNMTKDTDLWFQASSNIIGTSGNITVTMNP
jgi:hypothetical protein